MSHFSVLLVLPEKPTKGAIDRALAPWHEFNGSGYDHEYVVETDITDEALATIEKSTETRVRDGDGVLHDPYDEDANLKPQFSRYDDEHERHLFHVPEGFERVELPLASIAVDIPEWIADYYGMKTLKLGEMPDYLDAHKYGFVTVGDDNEIIRVVKRTNPDGKWDYWTLGGRYAGRLKPHYDPEKDPDNQEKCFLCYGTGVRDDDIAREQRLSKPEYQCNGCNGKGMRPKWPSKWKDVGNTARWGDLDLAELKVSSVATRREWVEEMRLRTGLSPEEFEAGHRARRAAHAVWENLDEPRPRGPEYSEWLRETQPDGELAAKVRIEDTWNDIDTPDGMSISDWIETAPALSAYSAVVDGKWLSRGEVGWFGISTGETDDWPEQFERILTSIPADHYVAIVDCHT